MRRLLLVGGLVGAAAVVALLLRPGKPAAPVDAPAATATVAPAVPPTAPVAPVAPPVAPNVKQASVDPHAAPLDDPEHPGAPPGAKLAKPPETVPLSKQEKLDLLAPSVPDLERRVARLRKEADEDERKGHPDAAKEKRVAADRHERRLGEIRASLATGALPPNFANPSKEAPAH